MTCLLSVRYWSGPKFSFGGTRYRAEAADIEPKPGHHIPVWLGTFGPRALAATGRLADGWIPSLGYTPPEQLPVMRDQVLAAARAAGRDPAQLTCALNLQVQLGGQAGDDPGVLAGSPGEVAEQITGFARTGFTAFNFLPAGGSLDENAERLARDVVPAVTAAV